MIATNGTSNRLQARLKGRARRAVWRARNVSRVVASQLSPKPEAAAMALAAALRRDGIIVSRAPDVFARSGEALIADVGRAAHRLWEQEKSGQRREETAARQDAYAAAGKDYRASLIGELLDVNDPFVRLALDPTVLNAVQRYLGMRPFLRDISLWWDRPTEGPPKETQLWHEDGDDVLNVKMFVYFTNVTADGGPFCFIPGTHPLGARHPLAPERDTHGRATDEQMGRVMPPDAWRVYTGSSGTTVLCDTCGWHKGLKPKRDERLMLVVHYTSGTPRYPRRLQLTGTPAQPLSHLQQHALGL